MKIFEGFNNSGGDVCPICKTGESKKTVLIPIAGTEDGNVMQAIQIHLDCIDLLCQKQKDGSMLLFQFIYPINSNIETE